MSLKSNTNNCITNRPSLCCIWLLCCFCSCFLEGEGGSQKLLVPVKGGLEEFASVAGNGSSVGDFSGFSAEVFLKALQASRIPSEAPNFTFIPFHDAQDPTQTPSYDAIVRAVHKGVADGIVADLTITSKRMELVDFTQPYIESNIAMVTKFRYESKGTFWDFLRPFSKELWWVLLGFFITTSVVLFVLEDRNPDFATHGRQPTSSSSLKHGSTIYDEASDYHRIMNSLWYTSLCVFMAQHKFLELNKLRSPYIDAL